MYTSRSGKNVLFGFLRMKKDQENYAKFQSFQTFVEVFVDIRLTQFSDVFKVLAKRRLTFDNTEKFRNILFL
jgi:hypothetical protein